MLIPPSKKKSSRRIYEQCCAGFSIPHANRGIENPVEALWSDSPVSLVSSGGSDAGFKEFIKGNLWLQVGMGSKRAGSFKSS